MVKSRFAQLALIAITGSNKLANCRSLLLLQHLQPRARGLLFGMGTIQHSNTPVLNYSLFEDGYEDEFENGYEDEFEDDVPGESGPRFNIDTQGSASR
jgi:hypothetical protein